ncbi:MAG: nucleotide exchange factor GrpE [Parcubacteria group bacterium]|nr:nucleotide exchange factor GrpE [Parcubacteria group bacterium]
MNDTTEQHAQSDDSSARSQEQPSTDEAGAQKELEEAKRKAQEYLDGWKRAQADFQNYKKDELKRAEELRKLFNVGIISDIIGILDSFSLAFQNLPNDLHENEWVKGMRQIQFQMQDMLRAQGVEQIRALGEQFDPNVHEAVETVDADGTDDGEILEELQKGYRVNGRLIRPARVKVARLSTHTP